MLRRLSIRSQLALLLMIPILGLAGFTFSAARSAANTAARAEATSEAVSAAVDVTALVHEVQRERDLGVTFASAPDDQARDDYERQMGRVGGLLGTAEQAVARLPASTADRYAEGLASVRDLSDHRDDVLAGTRAATAAAPYEDAVDSLLSANAQLARDTTDAELRQQLEAFVAVNRAKDAYATQRGVLDQALLEGTWTDDSFTRAHALAATEASQTAIFRSAATADQLGEWETRVEGRASEPAEEQLATALATAPGDEFAIARDDWFRTASFRLDLIHDLEDVVADDVVATAETTASEARDNLIRIIGVGVALIATLTLVGVGVARSISRPIRWLTARAVAMSERDLPDFVAAIDRADTSPVPEPAPIDIRAGGEIGALATAFGSVQETAVRLAGEQADTRRRSAEMFVSLGRRNQSLLNRQLRMIENLEQQEEDPDYLEKLFRIDLLATRMRRNAESLLVLAGATELSRPDAPLAMDECLRLAISEVEDYTRVDITPLAPAAIAPVATRDVVHLLAELVENATSFSPPGQRVTIAGHVSDGHYLLAIVDHGLGMSEAQRIHANRRLEGATRGLDARTLGHHVIGHLAARHGIGVRLTETPSGGVTAVVSIPPAVWAEPGPEIDQGTPGPAAEPAASTSPDPGRGTRSGPVTVAEGEAEPEFAPVVETQPTVAAPPVPEPAPIEVTVAGSMGLPVRARGANLPAREVFDLGLAPPAAATITRSPEEARRLLEQFQSGVERGRTRPTDDIPTDDMPTDDIPTAGEKEPVA